MPMPPYPVTCYEPQCSRAAAYKVAARWSDGVTDELKTYYLACQECLPRLYALSMVKRAACLLAPGETLDAPAIFELHRGERDKTLKRRLDLEKEVIKPQMNSDEHR